MKNTDTIKKIALVPLFLLLGGLIYYALWVLPGGETKMTMGMYLVALVGAILGVAALFLIERLQNARNTRKGKGSGISAFVSFNSLDIAYARRLSKELRAQGIEADETHRISQSGVVDFISLLQPFDIMIVVLSKNHNYSNILKHEIDAAKSLGKRILCIEIDGSKHPSSLQKFPNINFATPTNAITQVVSMSVSLRASHEHVTSMEPAFA